MVGVVVVVVVVGVVVRNFFNWFSVVSVDLWLLVLVFFVVKVEIVCSLFVLVCCVVSVVLMCGVICV